MIGTAVSGKSMQTGQLRSPRASSARLTRRPPETTAIIRLMSRVRVPFASRRSSDPTPTRLEASSSAASAESRDANARWSTRISLARLRRVGSRAPRRRYAEDHLGLMPQDGDECGNDRGEERRAHDRSVRSDDPNGSPHDLLAKLTRRRRRRLPSQARRCRLGLRTRLVDGGQDQVLGSVIGIAIQRPQERRISEWSLLTRRALGFAGWLHDRLARRRWVGGRGHGDRPYKRGPGANRSRANDERARDAAMTFEHSGGLQVI